MSTHNEYWENSADRAKELQSLILLLVVLAPELSTPSDINCRYEEYDKPHFMLSLAGQAEMDCAVSFVAALLTADTVSWWLRQPPLEDHYDDPDKANCIAADAEWSSAGYWRNGAFVYERGPTLLHAIIAAAYAVEEQRKTR